MNTVPPPGDFYVTGGTMPPDAGSYVVREADEELFQALARGEYCYVLTTRQMGKSSFMARTARRLAAAGVQSAQITLETIRESSEAPSPDQFLYGVAWRIHNALGLTTRLAEWWRERELLSATQRFHEFLTELLLESRDGRIVVFVDEIDSTIGLPFADDFYATIRACYNGRASDPALNRLAFVLLGVATPAQLITDPVRTPFNVGTGIELTDFTPFEARPLSDGFPGDDGTRQVLLERVLYWTGGHPYLTQTVCRAIGVRAVEAFPSAGGDRSEAALQRLVDDEVDRLFLRSQAAREERNLKFVRSRLTQGHRDLRAVLQTYRRVLSGKVVDDKPASSAHASLKLAGVVRVDPAGRLRPRNRVYEKVFGPDWVKREIPRDRVRVVAAAAALVAVLAGGSTATFFWREARVQGLQSALLERLATSDFEGLVALAREHDYRWDQTRTPVVLTDEFLAQVDPGVFAEAPWIAGDADPEAVFLVIERGYRLYVSSRSLFGAMSFALEEIFLRSADGPVKERARSLAEEVRSAFIAHHRERTPGFEAPPARAEDDTLNAWVTLPAGEFEMGSLDGDPDEPPVRRVRLSGFSIQQYEVTNQEYGRFNPSHEFAAGRERHQSPRFRGTRRRRMPHGWEAACRPRRSGSTPHAGPARRVAGAIPGVTTHLTRLGCL